MIRSGALLFAALISTVPLAQAQEIREPELTGTLATGKFVFTAKCATCHGKQGQGTDKGPPFLSRIYRPDHHGDEAFRRAARNGARAHHWPFGNMPPVEGLTDNHLEQVIAWIRALQKENGIF